MTFWILRLGKADERLLRVLMSRRGKVLDMVMRGLTHLGDWASCVLFAAILLFLQDRGYDIPGVQASVSLLIAFLASQFLKRTISRPRPQLPHGMAFLVDPPDRFSFPSGHAACSMALALPVALALPLLPGTVILLLAVGVGISRCYLGVHYPGDVMAGWALAGLSNLAALAILG